MQATIKIAKVYTFDMPKYVYVQVNGIDKAAKIKADEVQSSGDGNYLNMSIKLDGKEVGKFRENTVCGWWIEDIPDDPKA